MASLLLNAGCQASRRLGAAAAVAVVDGAAEEEAAAAAAAAQEREEEAAECAICHASVYEAGVECDCCPGRFTCARHADGLCECPPGRWRLAFRHSLAELGALLACVRARVPEGGRTFRRQHAVDMLCMHSSFCGAMALLHGRACRLHAQPRAEQCER